MKVLLVQVQDWNSRLDTRRCGKLKASYQISIHPIAGCSLWNEISEIINPDVMCDGLSLFLVQKLSCIVLVGLCSDDGTSLPIANKTHTNMLWKSNKHHGLSSNCKNLCQHVKSFSLAAWKGLNDHRSRDGILQLRLLTGDRDTCNRRISCLKKKKTLCIWAGGMDRGGPSLFLGSSSCVAVHTSR